VHGGMLRGSATIQGRPASTNPPFRYCGWVALDCHRGGNALSPTEVQAMLAREHERYRRLIEEAGIKPDP
jgi:hypothetical protein